MRGSILLQRLRLFKGLGLFSARFRAIARECLKYTYSVRRHFDDRPPLLVGLCAVRGRASDALIACRTMVTIILETPCAATHEPLSLKSCTESMYVRISPYMHSYTCTCNVCTHIGLMHCFIS